MILAIVAAGKFDWVQMARDELQAMRSPNDLFDTPVCRFLAIRVPNDEVMADAINRDRVLIGLKPRPVNVLISELVASRKPKQEGHHG